MNAPARSRAILFGILCFLNLPLLICAGQGTAFTYQGRLSDGGAPANGSYDFQFAIYEGAAKINPVSGPVTNSATSVSNGFFTVTLDFGAAVFDGSDRWLEIGVRTNGVGSFIPLTSRQQMTSTPYAIQALRAGGVAASNITGTVTLTQLPAGVVTNGANVALLDANQTFSGTNVFSANVGIGTNNPPAPLYVQGAASDFHGAIMGLQTSGGANGGGVFGQSVVPGGFGVVGEADVPGGATVIPAGVGGYSFATNGAAIFGQATAANAYAAYMLGRGYFSGNVGIGTLSPAGSLQVVGGVLARGGPPGSSGVNNNGYMFAGNNGDSDSGMSSSANGQVEFYNNSIEAMRIVNGSVGIGTVNPAAPLDVSGTNGFPQLRISVPTNSPYGAFLSIDASSTTNGKNYLIFSTANAAGEGPGKLIIQNHSDGVPVMGITSNGNVGIGTLNPASRLQVVGNIQLGNGGASFAASAPENLRIVRGTVSSTGAIIKGSGFTVTHPGTGTYTITFTTPFSDVPTITATAVDIVVRAGAVISASSVNIGTANFGGASADDAFHFIAIGPP